MIIDSYKPFLRVRVKITSIFWREPLTATDMGQEDDVVVRL